MNTLQIGTYRHDAPAGWDELDPAQLCYIVPRMLKGMHKGAARLLFTQQLLNVRWYKPRLWWWWWVKMAPDERHHILQLADWIFEDNPKQNDFIIKQHNGLHGPAAAFADTTAKEWGVADGWFQKWQQTKSTEALDMFVAILYRPSPNCTRVPYNGNNFAHIEKVKRWPLSMKLGIIINYRHVRRILELENRHVFGNSAGGGSGNGGNWYDVLLSMAGDKFGPLPDTENTNIRPFLRELDHRLEQQKRAEEKNPS